MIFHTYGKKENKAVVLIHGMLTPWQIWNTAIKKFKRDYYVIVPELDAHTELNPTMFHSVEEEADKILADARIRIAAEKESALRDVRREVALLSVSIAEKILRKDLSSEEAGAEFISKMIDEAAKTSDKLS